MATTLNRLSSADGGQYSSTPALGYTGFRYSIFSRRQVLSRPAQNVGIMSTDDSIHLEWFVDWYTPP